MSRALWLLLYTFIIINGDFIMKNRKLRGDDEWHLIRGHGSEGIAYKLERNEYDKDYSEGISQWGHIEITTFTDTTGLFDTPDPDGHVLVTERYIELEDLSSQGKPGSDILREALEYIAIWGGKESFVKSRAAGFNFINDKFL